jgi:hypothetical protein
LPFSQTNVYDQYPEKASELLAAMTKIIEGGIDNLWEEDDQAGKEVFASAGFVCPWKDDDTSYMTPYTYVSS